MKKTIELQANDELELILPRGIKISIVYSDLEPEDCLLELDIMLPRDMAANCYTDHLKPAPEGVGEHVRIVKQIIIPVERIGTVNSCVQEES